ncbi:hypothetical protein EDF24_1469 [Curtobacterium sp. PhB130]|uniref:DUF5677 domain-containing protein n=1 Tax=Curtobacterium sp. PhB130 TaxID=2485178 RepID=UPI000F4BC2B7|nr:DUF5677 domain-containing protein [Curtobacterium sp. PhB130]ROS75894.1 hypothetical protein EDF24_1469 [Curtobacterium sp. PhB130]
MTDGEKEQFPVASFGGRAKWVEPNELRAYLVRLDAMRASADDRVDQADAFRKRLGSRYADGFRSLERMLEEAMDAADWASSTMDRLHADAGDGQYEQYYAVIKGLCARGLKTFAEVLWLLKGGYPDGATARVRTLHEIAVTITVIAVFGGPGCQHPELVDRFITHREAMVPRFARSLVASGMREATDFLDEETLVGLEARRQKLAEQYGKDFVQPNGWAAPLFKPKTRFTMSALMKLVAPTFEFYYSMASHPVHADSDGWRSAIVRDGDDVILSAGMTNLGLGLPAEVGSLLLLRVLDATVPSRVVTGQSVDRSGALLLAGVEHFRDIGMQAIETAEEAILDAEAALRPQSARPR